MTQRRRIAVPSFRLRKSRVAVLSPSGRYLAQLTSRVVLWDTVTRRVASSFKVISNEFFLAFSPDERVLAVMNANGEIVFCRVPSGRVISETGRFRANRQGPQPAFVPDGSHLVVGDHEGVLRLIEATTSRESAAHEFGEGYMFGDLAANLETGRMVAPLNAKHRTRGGGKLLVFDDPLDLASPKCVLPRPSGRTVAGGWPDVGRVAVHPSGDAAALAVSASGRVEADGIALVDLRSGDLRRVDLESARHSIRGVSWSSNGVLCASVHENVYERGMSSAEYRRLLESGSYEHVHFYRDSSLELFARWPWRGAADVAFSANGSALAVASSDEPGAYLARPEDWAPVT